VRRDIRQGAADLLEQLNARYDRVVVVAHSLGSYIAYDAIRYLWGEHNRDYAERLTPRPQEPRVPAGLDDLEAAAKDLAEGGPGDGRRAAYHRAQRALWEGLRAESHRWKITDLITLGSPMYMADDIYTADAAEFRKRVARHEFPTCPPQEDAPSWRSSREPPRDRRYTYVSGGRRVLYDAAPFAFIRWTNIWFPTKALFFGDWFGGPLGPLFGDGILDVPVTSGARRRFAPGLAHALYFSTIAERPGEQPATAFHDALRGRGA
jgi:hypothetical protein